MNYDVIVVGAGPAGSSAARLLAEQGVKVALVERSRMPRYKACGAGIVGRAMRLLPPAVKDAVERECFTAEMNMLDGGMHFEVTKQEPVIWMSMRDRLDYIMAMDAQRAGADLLEECRVLDIELRPARDLGKLLYGPAAIRNYLFRQKGQAFCEAVTDVVAGNASYRELAGKVLAHLKRLLPQDVVRLFSRVNAD